MRLDVYLAKNGIAKSRTAAQELIKRGAVVINGRICEKPSEEVSDGVLPQIAGERPRYVGRGGIKLECALEHFGISLKNAVCVDIGASTGGFTDCMLQHGAARVYAVDVGKEQLDAVLRADSRVVSMEQTDIRDAQIPEQADFIGTDVSFISLRLILPHIMRLLKYGGTAVTLIKPQFEAGRAALSKKGVVRDEKTRLRTAEEIKSFARECGFGVRAVIESPIRGKEGNIEYLMCIDKPSEDI